MRKTVIALFFLALIGLSMAGKWNQGKLNKKFEVPEHRKPKNPRVDVPKESLPSNWFWGNISGVDYLTVVKNQHIPQYCGSCWAEASTSAISDRIKIMRKAAFPEITISPQVLLSCDVSYSDFGCHGGDGITAYEYIAANNITDESCSVYQVSSLVHLH